jgi:predicted PurR-regulated permease PerM
LNSSFETYKQNTETEIDSLQQVINANTANIKKTADELGVKIEDTHKFTNQSIIDINKTVSQNTLYWIIAILVVALLVLLVFVLLRKQIFKQKTDLDSNLQDTQKVLEEEGVKLDNKLIEVLETQLKIINSNNSGTEKEADHTLALKVADEIIRIQKNLTRMDEKTKGLKQLTASVKRIQDNFASNGYEIVEMLGKAFNDGMKVSANFVPDEDLEAGQQTITRIIKPQVNYKGVMIQSGQIEVSQG